LIKNTNYYLGCAEIKSYKLNFIVHVVTNYTDSIVYTVTITDIAANL